jgi:uncharacterized protein
MTNIKRLLVATLFALCGAGPAAAQNGPQQLPTTLLNAGIHNIQAEVAQTPDERATGLMFRKAMGTSEGMLFAFEQATPQCFWMKNTLLPLSIAFLADDGTVVNIENMAPQTENPHCSAKPVRYALEMNEGWFAKRGVKAGAKIRGGPFGR